MAIATNEQVHQALSDVIYRLRQLYDGAPRRSVTIDHDGLRVQTRLQVIFLLKIADPVQAVIHEAIMTHALTAEKMGPGGFDRFIQVLLDLKTNGDRVTALKASQKALERSGATFASQLDLDRIIGWLPDDLIPLLREALELTGFGARVVVEKARGEVASVEQVFGYTYSFKPVFSVVAQLDEPAVVCIDGFVESVAELHSLLEASNESKMPVLLFSRGLSDDVIHTLRVNYDRGSLRVIPFIVPFDLEGINSLVDVATVAGGDVVSSTKGQLISTLKLSEQSRIPRAAVHPDRVVLINPGSHRRVIEHVTTLKERRDKTTDESLARILDLRIRSLAPNQVVIRLLDDEQFVVSSQAIDRVLRTLPILAQHGVTPSGEPARAALAASVNVLKCVEMLDSLGAVVTP